MVASSVTKWSMQRQTFSLSTLCTHSYKNSLLDDILYLVVNQFEILVVWWPQIWSIVKGVAFSRSRSTPIHIGHVTLYDSRTVSHAQCAGALLTFLPLYIKLCVI